MSRRQAGATPAPTAYHPAMGSITGRHWLHTISRLGVWLLVWLMLGATVDAVWPALAIGLALALAWQYRHWERLLRQLRSRQHWPAPDGVGVQGEVGALLYLRQRDMQRRRQRLQQVLRAFRKAANALPDGIVVLGPDLDIEWLNPAASDLLGLSSPRDIGLRLPNLLRAPQVAEWLAGGAAEQLFDLPSPVTPARRLSLRLIDYTGQQRLLVARDISKLMQLEQVRRDFVANVSHELRTPLTVVHGYLELLEPEPESAWAAPVAEMRRQSQRMTRLVEDLLTLSRLEAQDRLPNEPVPMAVMLATLLREAETLSAGQHRLVLEDRAGCDLLGAEAELHSAFANLVANAVRYTPAGGHITIRFRDDAGGRLLLEVEDSGPGIAAEHINRLTERFYRVSTSRSRATGGTGLGLAIVKHVLLLHQGQLEIDSEPGRGSRFRCAFQPARRIERQPTAAS